MTVQMCPGCEAPLEHCAACGATFSAWEASGGPVRTEPTEEQVTEVARAINPAAFRLGKWTDERLSIEAARKDAIEAAERVLSLLPQRVAPSVDEIAKALYLSKYPDSGMWDFVGADIRQRPWLQMASVVARLYASAPTVAEVKAEAVREHIAGLPDGEEWLAEYTAGVRAQALKDAAVIAESLDFGPAPPFSRPSAHRWGALQAAKRIRARAERGEA